MQDNPPDGGPDRWITGIEFVPFDCVSDGGGVMPCDQSPGFTAATVPESVTNDPVLMWEEIKCSTFGADAVDIAGRAKAKLLGTTSHRLESELWAGTVAKAELLPNQYLTDGNVTQLNGGTAVPFARALAWLQQSGAEYAEGNRLAIHCTAYTAGLWYTAGAIRFESGLLVDAFGNLIVAGTGYDGSSPTDVVDATWATAWAYVTTVPQVRLSNVEVLDQDYSRIDRTNNIDQVISYRIGSVAWDACCQVGIKVDHTKLYA